MESTKLIVGLGNPGKKYELNRHNIGFLVINRLAQFFKIRKSETESDYEFAQTEYKDNTVVLMKPLTFMNRSGYALREFFEEYDVQAANVLIIYDDVNIDFGTIRLRPSGSDGGHKGIQSIIYEMLTDEIPRMRIGIKNSNELEKFRYETNGDAVVDDEGKISESPAKYDLAAYVLSDFTKEEMEKMDIILESSKNAVLSFIEKGIAETMNLFNKNVLE